MLQKKHGMHKQKGLVELIILDISFVKFGIINQKLLIYLVPVALVVSYLNLEI